MLTSNLSCTSFKILASSSSLTNVIANPYKKKKKITCGYLNQF